MDKIVFREIPNYEELYEISKCGVIKSLHHNHKGLIRKLDLNKHGYYQIILTKNKKQKNFLVHRLVALTYIDNPKNHPVINHKDEDKLNNHVDNLEWCTIAYNSNYRGANLRKSKKISKPVNQYDLDGNFIKTHKSVTSASNSVNGNRSGISFCCNGYRKSHKTYMWEFVNKGSDGVE